MNFPHKWPMMASSGNGMRASGETWCMIKLGKYTWWVFDSVIAVTESMFSIDKSLQYYSHTATTISVYSGYTQFRNIYSLKCLRDVVESVWHNKRGIMICKEWSTFCTRSLWRFIYLAIHYDRVFYLTSSLTMVAAMMTTTFMILINGDNHDELTNYYKVSIWK